MSRLVASLLFLTFLTAAQPQQKKRVAVMNFEYGTVQHSVSALFGSNQDVGKGIADMLVDRLVQGGAYSVIERKELDKVIAEQNFSNSDRADPSSAAKIGRVLGIDLIVIGSITEFGSDDKQTTLGGGAKALSKFGIGGVKTSNASAVCQITARMINTSTAEILASTQGRGQKSRKGTGILGEGGSAAGMAGGVLDMKSSNFRQTLLGEAVNDAVTQVAQGLEQKAGAMPVTVVKVEGLVADVSGDTIVINVGSKGGVKKGDKLDISRTGRVINDPATGKVIRRIEDQIGSIVVTEVDDQSAVGKFTGSGTPKTGDRVATAK